ncbi:RNA polymerase sigma factor SigJ [Mumia quercus]|uniref:RNA polymerase sigma factor SigJ n=1 Tax=Mumia quercus TaxID=2976125 RepID=UPI0021D39BBA|nr:RNA polymerase sigma factor SigJ [Mumia quercus]
MTALEDDDLARLRPLAFAVAYRMLGAVSEAEDVAQETLVRLLAVDDADNPDALTTTIATRLSIDVLRSSRRRREQYVGDWLPEPLAAVGSTPQPDAYAHAALADDVSTAFLVLLESLSPAERAAFLLHDVFGYSHEEAASVLGRSVAATRQLVSRARRHVAHGRRRYDDDAARRQRLVDEFLAACQDGSVDAFAEVLAEDVVFTGDGGGNVPPGFAITRPVAGRDAVARLLAGFTRRGLPVAIEGTSVNGGPGVVVSAAAEVGGGIIAVMGLDVVEGRIAHVWSVVNPDKLRHVGRTADLARLAAGRSGSA